MKVPQHDNIRGWELFYDFIIRPYKTWSFRIRCAEIDPARDEDNRHWWSCKSKIMKRGGGGGAWGGVRGSRRGCLTVSPHWNAAVY